jgi:O-antigen/teichoic acid export membrane protein
MGAAGYPAPQPQPEAVPVRIVRNAAWLFCSEGITKSLFFAANILLARWLSAADYGLLALAQSWIVYAGILADMGIMMYGQAEAARRKDTVAVAWEIMPFRALLGAVVFVSMLVLIPLFASAALRLTITAASVYLLGQAISPEWLFRGRERFDVVMLANAAGAATFLAAVAWIGSRPGAQWKAALAWSLSAFAMSGVYLLFLRGVAGLPSRLRVSTAAWCRHLRESSFFALSNIIAESYRVLPFLLLGMLASARELGLFAAPLRLVTNLASLGFLIPMAFYPACARLFHERPEVFADRRRTLVLTMLAIGTPAALIGTRAATPIMIAIFGHRYRDSAGIFAMLVWMLPVYFVRYVYGTTILATGFQRLHTIASAVAAAIALMAGIPLVRYFGGAGAAASLICSEIAMTAAMITVSVRVHHEAAIPPPAKLIRLGAVLIATWLCGFVFDSAIGPLVSSMFMTATYIIGLAVSGLIDWPAVVQGFLTCGVLRLRATEPH